MGPQSSGWVYVAENDAGEIVGFACGGPERSGDPVYTGELYGIYVLPEYHRRGIGRRWIVKDLAALLYSSRPGPATGIRSPVFTGADRLRFARAYFGTRRLTADQRDLVWAAVRKARRIARHDARRAARTGGPA